MVKGGEKRAPDTPSLSWSLPWLPYSAFRPYNKNDFSVQSYRKDPCYALFGMWC